MTAANLVDLEPILPELPGCEAMVRQLVSSQGERFAGEALLVAVRRGDLSLAKLLARTGADWSYESEIGETPLALALSVGYTSLVHHIVAAGLTRYDPAALLAATAAAHSATPSAIFNVILGSRRGIGPYHYHQRDEAWTAFLEGLALATAVCLGDEYRVTQLLDAGIRHVERNPRVTRGTYLVRFYLSGDTTEVRGVGPESRHDHLLTIPATTLLGTACFAKQHTIIPLLLRHGYQPNRLDLAIAAQFMPQATLDLLLPLVLANDARSAVLSPLIRRGFTSQVDALLSAGADPNTLELPIPSFPRPLRTPLGAAILTDDIHLVSRLLRLGAHADGGNSLPPSHIASALAPSPPLSTAAARGNIAIVKLLLLHGADINGLHSPPGSRSAIESAAENGRIDVLGYLLSEGVATEGMHRLKYFRAVRLAEAEGHVLVVRMLREWRDWSAEDEVIFQGVDIDDDSNGGADDGGVEEEKEGGEEGWLLGLEVGGGREAWEEFFDWDGDWGSPRHEFSFE